ncbi:hypothetical protein [Streptomyces sp. NPDC093149]
MVRMLGLERVDAPSGAATGETLDVLLECLISIGYKRRPVACPGGRELPP